MRFVVAACRGEYVPANDNPEIFAVLDVFTEAQRNAIVATGNLHLSLFAIYRWLFFLLASWDDFTHQMCVILACIYIEEKSDIKKDLEDIRKCHVSDTRDITIAQEKEHAIRRVAEEDCETFWNYCKSEDGTDGKLQYVMLSLGEEICKEICNAETLNRVRHIMIDSACMYTEISIALRKQREEDLSPEPDEVFKPKLNLSIDAAYRELKDTHQSKKHDGELRDCRSCIMDFKRLISTDVYQELYRGHIDGGHTLDVFMCKACFMSKLN